MSNNSNNKSKAAVDPQESWASTISDYILLRRGQTYSAYQATDLEADTGSSLTDDPTCKLEDSYLFTAVFMMLATHLEEGHTVLTIKATEHEVPLQGQINHEVVMLYGWQQQLLEMLALPLFVLIDDVQPSDDTGSEMSLFDLLDILFSKRDQLWTQLALSNHQKATLTKRFDMVAMLYQVLKDTDLISFMHLISTHNLFDEVDTSNYDNKNSLSRNNKPITYKKTNNKDSEESMTFWLHRTWQAEFNLAKHINNILSQKVSPLQIAIPENLHEKQIKAINVSNNNAFSIITGGPGTGKTYTVAQLVIALQQASEGRGTKENIRFSTDSASLALAAPTGKAAQRMQESLQTALDASGVNLQLQEAKTIHRLLGIGRTGSPRYGADNPLGEDIIIVDEASMLGVELANYLVSAVKPGARLILLGDANQLAAVDAGAVLADLCHIPSLQPIHVELTESRRFSADSGIGKLAYQINNAKADTKAIWQLFKNDEALSFQSIHTKQTRDFENTEIKNSLNQKNTILKIAENYENYLKEVEILLGNPIEKSVPSSVKTTIKSLTKTFNEFRVLSAGHNGEWGDRYINNYLTQWHLAELKLPLGQNTWFHGRPIMVLQNNYELGLFNGDIGFCLQTSDNNSRLEVFFENKTQGIAVNLLNEELIATAYAMTIHKSQGSEFDHVAITFDNSHARLLSKELIYTAVTRAKKKVTVYSTKHTFEIAVTTPTERHTGLALQF